MSFKFQIKGLKELEKGLRSLPLKVAKRVLGKSIRSGADLALTAMKERVPVYSGNLKDSLKIKARRVNEFDYRVTVGSFLSGKKGDPWYASLVEYGGAWVVKARGGNGKGRIVATGRRGPNSFVRAPYEAQKDAIIRLISFELEKGVAFQLRKIARAKGG